MVRMLYSSVVLNITNFESPWAPYISSHSQWLSIYKFVSVIARIKEQTLQTSFHELGIWPSPNTDSRLGYTDFEIIDANRDFSDPSNYHYLLLVVIGGMGMHNESERVYPNLIDTLSDFGGLIDCILLFVYFVYWPYANRRMHNNMIHKSLMITGKFNLDDDEAEYLSSIYSPAHYIKPSFKGSSL